MIASEDPEPPPSAGGRVRRAATTAGAALVATLYDDEPPAGPLARGDRTRLVVRLVPVLALALAVFAVVIRPEASLLQKAVLALGAVPVALLPRRPLLAWRVAIVAGAFGQWLGAGSAWPANPVQVAGLLAALTAVALTRPRPVVLWVGAITLAGGLLVLPAPDRPLLVIPLLLLVTGDQVRQRRAAQAALAREQERVVLVAERTRIARDLHDVVAHHMSLLAVRAETAPFRIEGDLPEPVRAEFTAISAGARQALVEMRRVLGVLRSDDHRAPLVPQPGLADLEALVASDRAAGADITLEVGPLPDTPGSVAVTAYRVVQEALSNAARHAPGASVSVAVAVGRTAAGAHALDVRVRNSPPPVPRRRNESGGGHGLIGMRERVAAVGGELTARPTDAGGFEVHAVLPLSP